MKSTTGGYLYDKKVHKGRETDRRYPIQQGSRRDNQHNELVKPRMQVVHKYPNLLNRRFDFKRISLKNVLTPA